MTDGLIRLIAAFRLAILLSLSVNTSSIPISLHMAVALSRPGPVQTK